MLERALAVPIMLERALAVPIMLERTFRRLRRRSIEHDRRRGGQFKCGH